MPMTLEERLMEILSEEILAANYGEFGASVEGREVAVRRIMDEIIDPILIDAKGL